MIIANIDEWVPTMMLRFDGGMLEQLWITPLGKQEWRAVPGKDKSGFRATTVGHVDMNEE